ncbi:cupin domain-containing protein [Sneathiella marina]|uniref:Cupin domain-containing protein n=1 Tax=Sneathiella marina TaxID=2950108 RepID=A0ABY4W9Y3_9PROT|nr:cupin domain-containing protein [Sneathiella marina]USG62575.1 cupin domain-containing protein [Sneathiella marina]
MENKLKPVRRVVTGHNDAGYSVIEEDGMSPATKTIEGRPDYAVTNIWRTGKSPADVHADDDILEHRGVTPPEMGTVIRAIDIPPETGDPEEFRKIVEKTFKTLYPDAEHAPSDTRHYGMHKTSTVDYAIIIEGELTAIMDEGETVLKAGDILIQRGTNHGWANRSDAMCRVVFILVDGR